MMITNFEKTSMNFLSYVQEKYGEHHVIVKVLSNGTLLTEDLAKKIVRDYPILKGIMVSLDGVREETHDKIRGKGNYKKALEAFGILNKHGIEAATHMVVHKGNFEEAFLLTDFAKRHNLDMLTVTRLVPIGCGKEIANLVISKEEVRELYLKLSEDADNLARENSNLEIVRFRCDWPVLFTPKDHEISELYYPYEKNGGACAVARYAITVLSDGTLLPCQRMPIELGNVLETDFATLWNHPFLWKMRRRPKYMKGKCQNCEFLKDPYLNFACNGGAPCLSYAYYNDPFQPDPGCSYEPGVSGEGSDF